MAVLLTAQNDTGATAFSTAFDVPFMFNKLTQALLAVSLASVAC